MTTLREKLVREWGESVLSRREILDAKADLDFDEEVVREYHAPDGSKLFVAGESAIVSTPTNVLVMRADEVDDYLDSEGDWQEIKLT